MICRFLYSFNVDNITLHFEEMLQTMPSTHKLKLLWWSIGYYDKMKLLVQYFTRLKWRRPRIQKIQIQISVQTNRTWSDVQNSSLRCFVNGNSHKFILMDKTCRFFHMLNENLKPTMSPIGEKTISMHPKNCRIFWLTSR